ncbi:MAG: hypothetical protein E3K37_17605 [Candidatus Kuenenia sp.]|nr:hypothetical protein [Candidatus Kuenenia hertensis]
MPYNDTNYEWTKKGGTLSDKTAFKEFGLTQNDIMKAINEGKLQEIKFDVKAGYE